MISALSCCIWLNFWGLECIGESNLIWGHLNIQVMPTQAIQCLSFSTIQKIKQYLVALFFFFFPSLLTYECTFYSHSKGKKFFILFFISSLSSGCFFQATFLLPSWYNSFLSEPYISLYAFSFNSWGKEQLLFFFFEMPSSNPLSNSTVSNCSSLSLLLTSSLFLKLHIFLPFQLSLFSLFYFFLSHLPGKLPICIKC